MFLQNFEDPPAPLFLASTVAQSKAILIPDPLHMGLFLTFTMMCLHVGFINSHCAGGLLDPFNLKIHKYVLRF